MADVHARDVQAVLGRDEARGIGTGPATVRVVAKVELNPGGGELTEAGDGDGATDGASAATLSVLVEDDVLDTAGRELEVDGLVVAEEAVDATIGTDLVPASAGRVGAGVRELDRVVVLVDNVGLDKHLVAAGLGSRAGVTLVGNLSDSSTLARTTAEATEDGKTVTDSVGSSVDGTLDGVADGGSGSRLGRRRSRRRRSSSRRGLRRRSGRSRLLGHDKLGASLNRALGVQVSVAAGVSSDAEGGSENDRSELHDVGCFC